MRFKYLVLFVLTLLFPILNYGMIAEEKPSITHSKQVNISEFKKSIQEHIFKLKNLLEASYLKLGQKKGWLDWEDELGKHQGTLIAFFNNIDPSKKHVLTSINKEIAKENNEISNQILLMIARINADVSTLPDVMIESKISEYFENTANIGNVLEIKDKGEGNGVQFGKIALIRTGEGKILQYYVKTHRLGLLSQTGSSAKPVDLKEPFAYKFLEICGIAPEVHFFYDDDKYFYIATKNEGYSFNGETEFITYDKIRSNQEYPNDKDMQSSFLMTDFYSRILQLSDVLNNYGNIGFIKQGHNFIGFKVIDFETPKSQESYVFKGIYEGWTDGNNQFHYQDKHISGIIRSLKLKGTSVYFDKEHLEIKRKALINALPMNSGICQTNIRKAFECISAIAEDLKLNTDDLAIYAKSSESNCIELYEKIQQQKEITSFF